MDGTYKCDFRSKENRSIKYRIVGFCISKTGLTADIFMNQLVNEPGKTIDFAFNESTLLKAVYKSRNLGDPVFETETLDY